MLFGYTTGGNLTTVGAFSPKGVGWEGLLIGIKLMLISGWEGFFVGENFKRIVPV